MLSFSRREWSVQLVVGRISILLAGVLAAMQPVVAQDVRGQTPMAGQVSTDDAREASGPPEAGVVAGRFSAPTPAENREILAAALMSPLLRDLTPAPSLAREAALVVSSESAGRFSSTRGSKSVGRWALIVGAMGTASGIYRLTLLGRGQCKGKDPAYTDSCALLGTLGGLSLASGVMSLTTAVLRWPHGSSAPRPVGQHPDGRVTTEIRNGTPYLIEALFEGPVIRTVAVAARQSATIVLEPGRYQETVRAMDGPVEPYRALQTYNRGIAYVETYFHRR